MYAGRGGCGGEVRYTGFLCAVSPNRWCDGVWSVDIPVADGIGNRGESVGFPEIDERKDWRDQQEEGEHPALEFETEASRLSFHGIGVLEGAKEPKRRSVIGI